MSDGLPTVGRNSDLPTVISEIKTCIGPALNAIDNLKTRGFPDELDKNLSELRESIISLDLIINKSKFDYNLIEEKSFYPLKIAKKVLYFMLFALFMIAMLFIPNPFTSIIDKSPNFASIFYFIIWMFYLLSFIFASFLIFSHKNREEIYKSSDFTILEDSDNATVERVIEKSNNLKNKLSKIPRFKNPEYTCIGDNEKCMQYFEGRSGLYKVLCALAFTTCVARSLIPFAGRPGKNDADKS